MFSTENFELARAIAKAQFLLNCELRGKSDQEIENLADRFADVRWQDYRKLADITICMLLERGFDIMETYDD